VCVEYNRRALAALRANVRATGFEDRVRILARPVSQALRSLGQDKQAFDIIFMDPPYHQNLVLPTARLIAANHLLRPGGVVAAEHAADELKKLPADDMSLLMLEQRRYGTTTLTFLGCQQTGQTAGEGH
jgi:16S rRNA (guanine966-N2)-methyltransferase